jgi:EAL domain-containing protein (putative c-di-GMP-specific phosphodiesterase class I)
MPSPSNAQAEQRQSPDRLRGIIGNGGLSSVFEPVACFEDASIFGYEALIRGPADTPLHHPLELLRAARAAKITAEFEIAY